MGNKLYAILELYGFLKDKYSIEPLGNGLINSTWKVVAGDASYVLQKINDKVFANPFDIDFNISVLGKFIAEHHPGYFFVNPLPTVKGNTMVFENGIGYFRLFQYVSGSKTIQTVESPEQAFEAAQQFAKFTATVSSFDCRQLKITIPSFHDLSLRYNQFCNALKNGNEKRINEESAFIKEVQSFYCIVKNYEQIKKDGAFKLRATHHDTKISNVLFDYANKGICVIDLDTVMPGYFISDVGDMMRTYLSPVNEE
ncbi:MAG: aminoglycoside phosphotransferase family protein, partial [Chitinophagaceae bacterium]|nr:aminoglycoside phosphotransferase family protein [Chitinophagaceae bacterium]